MQLARRAAAAVLTLAMAVTAVGIPTPAGATVTLTDRVSWAAGYISATQRVNGSIPAFSTVGSTADAVVSLVAARRGPQNIKFAMRYLGKRVAADDYQVGPSEVIGVQAKIVLAAVASGRDPHDFGGHDLVQTLLGSEQSDGRYGATSAVFNDATAMLALEAAGVTPSSKARAWLIAGQCGDGGWAYDQPPQPNDDSHCTDTIDPPSDYFPTDTNTTSLAVQALSNFNGAQPAVDPFTFFDAARDGSAGWGYSLYYSTDANSTSMVIQAYAATSTPLPAGAMTALKALQYKFCGGFKYSNDPWVTGPDVGSTSAAILGLLRKPLPVMPATVTQPATAPIGCP